MATKTSRVGRPPGPRRDPAERRDELLDACVRAIRTLGPEASMADLAAEAGVTRPILYDHFGDRAGVATALAARYTSFLGVTLETVMGQQAPFDAILRDGIDVFCRFVDKEPALWRFLQAAGGEGGSIEFAVGRMLADTLRAALDKAGADPALADVWAAAIIGAVFLAAEHWSNQDDKHRISRKALVSQLTALLVGGLAATGADEAVGPFS